MLAGPVIYVIYRAFNNVDCFIERIGSNELVVLEHRKRKQGRWHLHFVKALVVAHHQIIICSRSDRFALYFNVTSAHGVGFASILYHRSVSFQGLLAGCEVWGELNVLESWGWYLVWRLPLDHRYLDRYLIDLFHWCELFQILLIYCNSILFI